MKKLLLLGALALGLASSSQAAITWHWNSTAGSTAIRNEITNSMNSACAAYGSNGSWNIGVRYNSAVPTAQASHGGEIQFGGQRTTRTALHEMAHWLGCGTYSVWNSKRSGNNWTGSIANNRVKTYDGSAAIMHADAQHHWPYGLNYESEYNTTSRARNPMIVGAMRRDMGLSGW